MLATRRALWFAKELGFHSLIVEGDSEIIINSINGNNMAQSEFGHILQDIKFLCPLDVWMKFVPPNTIDVYNFDLRFIT